MKFLILVVILTLAFVGLANGGGGEEYGVEDDDGVDDDGKPDDDFDGTDNGSSEGNDSDENVYDEKGVRITSDDGQSFK